MGTAGWGLWRYHEKPEFCATCHIMQSYLESWQSSDHLVRIHAKEGSECLDCHVPTIQQQMQEGLKYIIRDYETPLAERSLDPEFCLSCKEHGSYDEIRERTRNNPERNPHDSHWGEMDCGLCHNMHRESVDYCSQCHPPVTDKPGWVTTSQ